MVCDNFVDVCFTARVIEEAYLFNIDSVYCFELCLIYSRDLSFDLKIANRFNSISLDSGWLLENCQLGVK